MHLEEKVDKSQAKEEECINLDENPNDITSQRYIRAESFEIDKKTENKSEEKKIENDDLPIAPSEAHTADPAKEDPLEPERKKKSEEKSQPIPEKIQENIIPKFKKGSPLLKLEIKNSKNKQYNIHYSWTI